MAIVIKYQHIVHNYILIEFELFRYTIDRRFSLKEPSFTLSYSGIPLIEDSLLKKLVLRGLCKQFGIVAFILLKALSKQIGIKENKSK